MRLCHKWIDVVHDDSVDDFCLCILTKRTINVHNLQLVFIQRKGKCLVCFIHECVLLSVPQVIRILKELKQKYPDKELDQLVELANYYALLHQQKSRAFYRIQVTHTHMCMHRLLIVNPGGKHSRLPRPTKRT